MHTYYVKCMCQCILREIHQTAPLRHFLRAAHCCLHRPTPILVALTTKATNGTIVIAAPGLTLKLPRVVYLESLEEQRLVRGHSY
jgi:hypothetical protein